MNRLLLTVAVLPCPSKPSQALLPWALERISLLVTLTPAAPGLVVMPLPMLKPIRLLVMMAVLPPASTRMPSAMPSVAGAVKLVAGVPITLWLTFTPVSLMRISALLLLSPPLPKPYTARPMMLVPAPPAATSRPMAMVEVPLSCTSGPPTLPRAVVPAAPTNPPAPSTAAFVLPMFCVWVVPSR